MVCELDFTSSLEQWFSNFSVQQYHLEGLLKNRLVGPHTNF